MSNNRLLACIIAIVGVAVGPSNLLAQFPGGIPQTLDIEQAVNIALQRNLSIDLARSQVETAGARLTSGFGAFLPQISVSSGYTRQLGDGTRFYQGTPIPGTAQPDNYNANISASLLLFDGFSRTASYSASQSNVTASLETLTRTREDIAFQTRSAFLNVLRSEQIVEVRKVDLESSREQLTRAQGLVEAGSAQIGTVYSQEAEVANAELSLEQAKTDLIVARNALKAVLNVEPSLDLQVTSEGLASSLDSAAIARTTTELGTTQEMIVRQARQRRDLRAAQLQVDASKSSLTASKSGYYPSVSASIGYGWQASGDLSSSSSQFGLNLQYSPFDGFRTNEQVQVAEAQVTTAEVDLRRKQVQAQSDLLQAIARLEGAERQVRAASKAVAAARQSRFSADERYKVGTGSYTDYLLANGQYLNAQVNQVNAVFNYRLALYEVKYQLGE